MNCILWTIWSAFPFLVGRIRAVIFTVVAQFFGVFPFLVGRIRAVWNMLLHIDKE